MQHCVVTVARILSVPVPLRRFVVARAARDICKRRRCFKIDPDEIGLSLIKLALQLLRRSAACHKRISLGGYCTGG
jgi:hypothetical protein